jgi:hypothetical protein
VLGTVWDVARALADWWDAVELWLTQLSFPLQVVLGVLVLLPACWGGAAAIDRLCDLAAARLDVRRGSGDG